MKPSTTPGRGKRQQTIVALIVLAALLLPAIPARAVYHGDLTGERFSNVGIVFMERTSPKDETTGGGPPEVWDHCTGVLIANNLVLTAGTCANDPWDKFAYFSPVDDYNPTYDWGEKDENGDYRPFAYDYSTPDPNDRLAPWNKHVPICREPCYRGEVVRASSSGVGGHNLAVLRFKENIAEELDIDPAALPAYDSLNGLQGQRVTTVGYGDVGCEGPGCPADGIDAFFDDDSDNFPEYDWIEYTIIRDEANDPPAWWRYIELTQRRSAVMEVVSESGDWPKNGNKFLEVSETEDDYACEEAGGAYFLGDNDPDGTLVAINFDFDCSPVTDVLRLDTSNARNFLCSKQFPELKASLLCGGAAAQSLAADDGGKQSADRAHKGKQNGKHRGKGKRGR